MKYLCIITLMFLCSSCLPAQTENSQLKEIRELFRQKKTTVSAVLTDTRYLALHPSTPFRELIREFCNSAVLGITTKEEPGKKIRVLGDVVDPDGKPVAGALVYLYQTDARGWYASDAPHVAQNEGDMRHARLFGYVRTDASGLFELHTVKPSGYPGSDLPAHIHVHVWADGYQNFVNEFLFDDDERLTGVIREQSLRNRFLVEKPEPAAAPFEQQFRYRIVLQRR